MSANSISTGHPSCSFKAARAGQCSTFTEARNWPDAFKNPLAKYICFCLLVCGCHSEKENRDGNEERERERGRESEREGANKGKGDKQPAVLKAMTFKIPVGDGEIKASERPEQRGAGSWEGRDRVVTGTSLILHGGPNKTAGGGAWKVSMRAG